MKNSGLFFLWLGLMIVLGIVALSGNSTREIGYIEFQNLVNDGMLTSVTITDGEIISGQYISSVTPDLNSQEVTSEITEISLRYNVQSDPNFLKHLKEKNVDFRFKKSVNLSWLTPLIFMLGFVLLIVFAVKKMGSAGGQGGPPGMGGGQSKHINVYSPGQTGVTFADVAGIDEAKEEITEIVEFLKHPDVFARLGAKIPKGALLVGPPGTGKTHLAKAIASEAKVPFFYSSGSEFIEMYVGVGASRVRQLFEKAKKMAPCIVFIDEIDGIGGKRGANNGGNNEGDKTLNQLLVEMDGFDGHQGIIVIAATNRVDMLDKALTRPGRFDRTIHINPPPMKGRFEILKIHTKSEKHNIPLSEDVDLEVIARGTGGFTGAELASLVNEAALIAGKLGRDFVTSDDFEHAKDKILMGVEQKNLQLSNEEKYKTAIHEAGHTLISLMLQNTLDPIHKVSIIPRARSLGVTISLPSKERAYNYTKQKCEDLITMMMGGRVAEELIFNEITTGASNDIKQATSIARSMVYQWGMSEMGAVDYERDSASHLEKFSEGMRAEADQTVKSILDLNLERSLKMIKDNKDKLKEIADALIEKETLTGEDVTNIFNS